MTEAHVEKAVPVGRDQPPAMVDAFGVEEPGLLAVDIDEVAVAIEPWPVGYRIPAGDRGSVGRLKVFLHTELFNDRRAVVPSLGY